MAEEIDVSVVTRAAQLAAAVGGVYIVLTEDERAITRRYMQRVWVDLEDTLESRPRDGDVAKEIEHQLDVVRAVIDKLKK